MFDRLAGNQRVKESLRRMLAAGEDPRLIGGVESNGTVRVGQRTVLVALAVPGPRP